MTRIKVDLASSMRSAAGTATSTLRLLANEERLLLLCELCAGERSVGALEAKLDIRQPTLSQQLGVLRRDGMVRARRCGKQVYYSVADAKVHALLRTLQSLYC